MMKKMESKKSHPSSCYNSLFGPTNSKWIQVNLEEMAQHVRRMLKLIEGDTDESDKRVEMYYQKRPKLISLVEQMYVMYRSLAERYHDTKDQLQKTNVQSQKISSVGSKQLLHNNYHDQNNMIHSSRAVDIGINANNRTNSNIGSGSKQLKRVASSKFTEKSCCFIESYFDIVEFTFSDDDDEEEEDGTEFDLVIEDIFRKEPEEKLRNLSDCEEEFKESISSSKAGKSLLVENLELRDEVIRLCEVQSYLENYITETNNRCLSLDKVLRRFIRTESLADCGEQQSDLLSNIVENNNNAEELMNERSLIESLNLKYDVVVAERDQLKAKVAMIDAQLSSKDEQIEVMSKRLYELRMENYELIAETEVARINGREIEIESQETNERCESLEKILGEALVKRAEIIEEETLLASEVEQLKGSIVKKNNNVLELNKILEMISLHYETVVVERDQLRTRVAMFDADPKIG